MIGRIWAIAVNTHREAVRQKILYTLVFFGVVLILFSLFLGQLSLGADDKIVKDMGLACIMLFGAMMAIFMGIGLVFKEIERRTIYTILSKPVTRGEFILGKFFGLAITIGLEVVFMTALLFLLLSLYRSPLDLNLLKAVSLIYAELLILIAVALVFSSYSSSFMSALFCISFLVLGHVTDDFAAVMRPRVSKMLLSEDGGERFSGRILEGLSSAMETFSLDHFAISAKVVHGVPIGADWMSAAFLYALGWLTILLFAAVFLFRRKDLQ